MQRFFYLLTLLTLFLAPNIYAQCESVNPDCNILSDFDCQTNYIGLPAVANPASVPLNSSPLVGEYLDQNDAYDALTIDLGGARDLSLFNILKLKIYTTVSPQGRLLAILEGGTSPRIELALPAITDNAWTEYTFDFSSQANENHTRLVLIFNADITRSNGPEIYFLDDVRWESNGSGTDPCIGVSSEPLTLNDFECQQNEPFQTCFPIVSNPLVNVDNTSSQVGCYTDSGSEFSNIFIQFDGAIDLSTNNQFRMKLNTTIAGNLLVKLEGGTSPDFESSVAVSGNGNWENISVDFSSQATANHQRLVFFFNAGVIPGSNDKYFIDDLGWEVALPVTLIEFNTQKNDENVVLSWATSEETGAAEFIVQHSSTGSEWKEIGKINARGDSRTTQHYSYTHIKPGGGDHFYRLLMRDRDGSIRYSGTKSVLMNYEEQKLNAFPNPFSEELIISFLPTSVGSAMITLRDSRGHLVLRQVENMTSSGQHNIRLHVPSALNKGIYFLRLTLNGRMYSTRVIRQ